MTIQQFIEKAIEGGWKSDLMALPLARYEVDKISMQQEDVAGVWFYYAKNDHKNLPVRMSREFLMHQVVLDIEAWKAVGKVEGWGIEPSGSIWQGEPKWKIRMHRLIDALAEGKTVEEYLETL